MDNKKNLENQYVKEPVLDADKKPWTQNCFLCLEQINFHKDPSANKWIRVGPYIRHRKCLPAAIK